MKDLGFGQIIFLVIFILVPLIKFVLQQIRKRLEGQTPEEASVPQIRQQAQVAPAAPQTPHVSHNRVRNGQAPVVLTPLDRSHFTKKSLLGTPHDVRRGIVLMTILGPCRTLDPPD